LIGATRGGKLVAWDLDTKKESLLLQHTSPLVALAASSTGAILTADNQGRLLLGAALDATFKTFTIQSGEVSALGAVAGGWCIGSLDGRVLITDESGDRIRHEIGLRGPIWDLAFDSTENLLAIAPNESRVAIVTLNSATPKAPTVRSLAMTEGICDLDAVPHAIDIDCRVGRIVVGDSTGQSTIWALASGTPEMQLKTSERGPTSENLEKFPEVYRRRSAVVALTSGGASLWTGGANSLVMHWQIGRERLQHEWRTGPRPAAVFDRERADWVWVASGKRLEIVDSWSSRVLASTEVDGGDEIRGLVAARRSPSYATFSGHSIQFWRRTESTTRTRDESQPGQQRIETAAQSLRHDADILGLALSSDGQFAATYDVRDEVVIWNVGDGRKVQTIPIVTNDAAKQPQDALPHAYGKLFFDADDAQLLVIGPSQLPTLLSGRPWKFVRNPGVAGHRGPSAAAWHPTDP
ncbi:MAG TPA: WD40 repeat domain-containing protein, partial [Pirellulaceae bacterium]|nr:WD40 repeat domain-containing protein [Pirellulaceae bacterium]